LVAVPSIGRASEVTPRRAAPEADATRDLYERYARQIYSYCLHQLGNREEAEDATQSTFLNAFRGFKRGVDPEFESAWLYKIAQNVCLTRQRSSSRRRKVEAPGDLEAMQDFVPAPEVDSDELIRLPEALDAMPEQQRRALLLREWQGLSYKEIGDELDLSQAAVETLLFRARRSLAAGLSDEPATKAAGAGKRLGAGDLGSIISILKSLLFTGGVKVATAVATVAATSVVAATPMTRHAVEDVYAPRHDKAPVHQVSAKASTGSQGVARVGAPLLLVPRSSASAVRSAPLLPAAAKARRQRLALRAHASASATGAHVGHAPSIDAPAATASTPVAPVPSVETPASAATTEPAATAPAEAPATQPAAAQTGAGNGDTTEAEPAALVSPASPAKGKDRVLASTTDEKKNSDKKNAPEKGGKPVDPGKAPAVTATTTPVTPPVVTTTTTTSTVTSPADTTTTTTTPAPPTPVVADTTPPQAQNDASSRPAEGHRGDGKSNGSDGNGKKK
jgi:RNA polymerase sigma factor (sigma-70 family)